MRRPSGLEGPFRWLGLLATDSRGTSAVEFALVAGFLIVALFNAVDLGRYYYLRMEAENAAQTAAQAAWQACDTAHLPATTNCSGLNAAMTAGVQSTSLGASVALAAGYPVEGYYCVNASGALVYVSPVSSKPADCSSVGSASDKPGDYIQVRASYSYASLFPGVSIGDTLPTPIVATALMRLQ